MRETARANWKSRRTGIRHIGAMVGDLLNLKRFKNRTARGEAAKKAEANRALFGRTKAEKKRDEVQAQRAGKLLDGHRIDDEASK